MSHYDVDYTKLTGDEKKKAAISDIIDYVGEERYKHLSKILKEDAGMMENCRQFELGCAFAGIQGYPVVAWYEELSGKPWVD